MAERAYYGPVVPSAEQVESESEQVVSSTQEIDEIAMESDESYGPALPVHLVSKSSTDVAEDSDDSDQNVYGPIPDTTNVQQRKLEERALEMRIRNCSQTNASSEQPAREEWMIELPSIVSKTSLGLTARTFKMKEGPDFSDRSGWTKNPNEPDSSQSFKHTFEIKTKRDKEQELIAKKLKKKHKKEKSLLELHQKKRKKEKKKKKEKERRPFSRDTDLQVNRFDDAKKKVLIKKAQLLDTRFSTGKDAKYL